MLLRLSLALLHTTSLPLSFSLSLSPSLLHTAHAHTQALSGLTFLLPCMFVFTCHFCSCRLEFCFCFASPFSPLPQSIGRGGILSKSASSLTNSQVLFFLEVIPWHQNGGEFEKKVFLLLSHLCGCVIASCALWLLVSALFPFSTHSVEATRVVWKISRSWVRC